MYCNIVFMIDIFVISKITQYRYYVIAITDVRSLGLSTKWRTLMIKKTMKVRENTFRKLEDPFENGAAKKYVFYVKVDDVAEGIPMATNPRDQKLTSGVATAIKESLLSNDGYFHLKNRGIVLSAESVHYNNKEKIATIIFSDELSHGNIDGGHTYKIVCEHKGENLEQYVQFEVMTGVEDIIENLAEARNTSVQVDAKSMAELAEKFDPIKEGLEGMPFFKRIAFKQNQISVDDETGKKNKMIDAREIVAIISMFNISLYDALHHPTQAYSSKAKMLDMYLKNPEEYREYVNIMPDIFDLYDAVEMEFADAYNAGGGRYGRKKYAGYKDGKIVAKSKFGLNKMQYKVPDGLLYPVVAAFRSLLVKNKVTGKYEWKNGVGPIDVWDNNKEDLVNKIMNFAASIGDNPNAVGKDSNIWDLAYMTIMLTKFVHDDNVYCKYYEVFYILFHTGLRISEFCGLTIKDIDLKNRIINIDHQLQRIGSMEYHIESTKTNAGTRKLPMTEDVFRMFRAILEDRPTDFPEIMVDGYVGFLFRDKNGMPEVALHWEHRLKNAVNRYNSIFRVQLPKITPHICRHTYCSNQAKAGMNPKTLQYLMGHSDIGVTMNTYTHLSLDDAKNEMIRMEELEQARKEVDKAEDKKPMKQNMFKVV